MVLEIPPVDGESSITGSVNEAWQTAIEDVGPAGVDKGKGGKYLIAAGIPGAVASGLHRAAVGNVRRLRAPALPPTRRRLLTTAQLFCSSVPNRRSALSLTGWRLLRGAPGFHTSAGMAQPRLTTTRAGSCRTSRSTSELKDEVDRLCRVHDQRGQGPSPCQGRPPMSTGQGPPGDGGAGSDFSFQPPDVEPFLFSLAVIPEWMAEERIQTAQEAMHEASTDQVLGRLVCSGGALGQSSSTVSRTIRRFDLALELPRFVGAKPGLARSHQSGARLPCGAEVIGDRTPGLKRGPDGSLELYLQSERPDDKAANWLPAPKGPFYVLLRMYAPKQALVTDDHKLPPIKRVP